MNYFLYYPEIEIPESFDNWYRKEKEEAEENDGSWHPEDKHFSNVSEVYEYYAEFIPKEIWFEFSLFLAKVIDYYIKEEEPMEGYVL